MSLEVKKVSELVNEIKVSLESEFSNISVEGEITNLSLSSSGHWYFTISDKDSALSAALFKMDALRNPMINKIKDGAKVVVVGDINVYPKRGTFQIIVKRIVPVGVGDLKEQFEKLKKKLASEGLFDLEAKKAIPTLPKRVAIITAQRGAALQDFINIYKRRSLWMNLLVVPTLVQGDDAPRAIRASLHNVIKYSMQAAPEQKIDLIVLARGGGSLEDLWAFNDEGLAYDIFNCPIPTISAIGHEVDFSISDFVADLRCETPSAAAEVITQSQTMIKERMKTSRSRLLTVTKYKINLYENKLKRSHPNAILAMILRNFSNYQKRLSRLDISKRFNELTHIHDFYLELDDNIQRIVRALNDKMKTLTHKLDKAENVIHALNPKNVLGRGYSYLESSEGKVLANTSDFDKVASNQSMTLHFHDGKRQVKSDEAKK